MADGSDDLAHWAKEPYDPKKAHEYYMRTRELKGRKTASKAEPKKRSNRSAASAKIAHLRKKAAAEKEHLAKALEAFIAREEASAATTTAPVNQTLKRTQYEIANQRRLTGTKLEKVAEDLKKAIAAAQAKYKNRKPSK